MNKGKAILSSVRGNRLTHSEWILLMSLMLFCFVPSVNQLIVDRLISSLGNDILNIAGQIEWFDLFNETVLAFLTVPLYFVLNKVAKDHRQFKTRIMQTLTIGFIAYFLISVIIYLYASSLAAYMNAPDESLTYLRLETVGFVMSFIGSYVYVVLVVRGRWDYIVAMLIIKVALLSIGNIYMIPQYGVVGVAITNIVVNAAVSLSALYLVGKEGLLTCHFKFDGNTVGDWVRTGSFSGMQILLNNIVYMLVVMKMINDVSEIGSYWLANNFIWGWLLIPATAFAEIVKRDYYKGYSRIWNYILFMVILSIVWLVSVPFWNFMFTDIVVATDPQAVLNILYRLVPFYVAYILCVVFEGIFTSIGRTDYMLCVSAIVNIGYYGVVYGLFLAGVFTASMDFVIVMFGTGMIVSLAFDIIFFIYSRKKIFAARKSEMEKIVTGE